MVALWNRAGHYIFALWFLSLFFFYLFSSINLSMQSEIGAGLKCAVRGSLKIQDAKNWQKFPSGHHRTTLLGYVFATKARINNRKNLLSSNISSTRPPQYGELRPTSG